MIDQSLTDHIERYLGTIQRGWEATPDGKKIGFQVVECSQGYVNNTKAFCTLGLSNYPLHSRTSKKSIRHELLLLSPDDFGNRNLPSVLQQLGLSALVHKEAYLCGEVIERSNPVISGKPFFGFCSVVPTLLPDDFATYVDQGGQQIIFAWMIPVTKPEAAFIRKDGWTKLEDLFIARDIDLVDFDRQSVI